MGRRRYLQIPSFANIVIFGAPLLLSVLPICVPGQESKCAFVLLWMATYWITGCLPMGATSFIAVVGFTSLRILTLEEATQAYFSPGIWLFVGSVSMTVAAQTTKLHLRIALKVLLLIGCSPKRLLLGFMLTSYSMSMFIPNIVVTAMMIPIVQGVLDTIKEQQIELPVNKLLKKDLDTSDECIGSKSDIQMETTSLTESQMLQSYEQSKKNRWTNLSKGLTICVPYASSIGGVSSITGTIINIITIDFLKRTFPGTEEIGFGTWLCYCSPAAFFTVVVAYVWLTWLYFDIRHPRYWFKTDETELLEAKATKRMLEKEYSKLGPVKWEEKWLLAMFLVTLLLWLTRKPGFLPGWSEFISGEYVSDGTVSLAALLVLFVIPKERPPLFTNKNYRHQDRKKTRGILTWPDIQKHFMWELIFIIGGCFIISEAAEKSGLSQVVGRSIQFLTNYPTWAACLCLTLVAMVLTEVAGNAAVTNIMLPLLVQIAITVRVHPYYFCLPTILSTSLAFMLPVSTPPNVIAYNLGHLRIIDMFKAGWFLNIVGVFFINLSINTYGMLFFDLKTFPEWANIENVGNATASGTSTIAGSVM